MVETACGLAERLEPDCYRSGILALVFAGRRRLGACWGQAKQKLRSGYRAGKAAAKGGAQRACEAAAEPCVCVLSRVVL